MDVYLNISIQKVVYKQLHALLSCVIMLIEYSRAVTPQVRQAGNRLSGLTETAYASLLA